MAELFDVFLCHNGEDKPAVREIAQRLVKPGIKPWLDEEQIRPGTSWQKALGQQIEIIKSAAVFVGKNGIGPWQDEEIQALLSEFMRRNCPVIPTVLVDAMNTPELPWTLRNRHLVDFRVSEPDPLKQLIWGITGVKSIAPEPLIQGEDNVTPRKRFSEARLNPPLAKAPDGEQEVQLHVLRDRVSEYWIDGVLRHSLYNEVLISLDKRQVDKNVDAPWKYTVEVADLADSTRLDNRDVSAIYDATGLMLILGEPGGGKTTTLLDLARTLLERAKDNVKERIPVVVNLSSWKKKQPLEDWISNELSEKYRIPRKIARFWLLQGYLLPLLDGLDELENALQPDCVAAINVFIEEFQPSGLVVCCRLNEYRWLPKRLKLNGAICIEPLSSEEIGKYLDAGGSKLAALRESVDTDPVLKELAETPLVLSIMSLAYQGVRISGLAAKNGDSPEERRLQIFRLYVDKMFERKETGSPKLPKEKTIHWLSWLASEMREHSQSVFTVEGLQPSWLGANVKWEEYHMNLVYSLGCGLCNGLRVDPRVIIGDNVGPTRRDEGRGLWIVLCIDCRVGHRARV
jgi:TIR domain/NACHT domain